MGPIEPPMGLFPGTPIGRDLPISCAYPFGSGGLDTAGVPARWDVPLPEGFKVEILQADDPQITEAGFDAPSRLWFDPETQTASMEEKPGTTLLAWRYLRDPEGKLVATWDEGRWWTPEESEAFHLMLMVPGVASIDAYGLGTDTPKGGIEWPE